MKDLRGRLAVVTGGAGGLGRATAERLLEAGCRVALWDLDAGRLEEARAALAGRGEVAVYEIDVGDREAVSEAARRVERELGPVDILDNNAGIMRPGSFLDADPAGCEATVRVNLLSYMWCVKAFLPGMIERGRGHLVFIASAAGLVGVPGMAAYSAAKHAVVGFAESLRQELSREGVKGVGMTIVCPSFIATGMFEGCEPPRWTRWLTPEEVAAHAVRAIREDRLYVREPFLVKWLPLMRALPTGIFDRITRWTRADRALEGFRGK
jgi:NAD(P)-dependent dehydrogenase (short-subunit alcohol dehydrogenase family)